MTKYYRVLKDTFLWEKDAILSNNEDNNHYSPIEDIWDKLEDQDEYITAKYIENNPKWFQRVYATNLEKKIFKTAEMLKKVYVKFVE